MYQFKGPHCQSGLVTVDTEVEGSSKVSDSDGSFNFSSSLALGR